MILLITVACKQYAQVLTSFPSSEGCAVSDGAKLTSGISCSAVG